MTTGFKRYARIADNKITHVVMHSNPKWPSMNNWEFAPGHWEEIPDNVKCGWFRTSDQGEWQQPTNPLR